MRSKNIGGLEQIELQGLGYAFLDTGTYLRCTVPVVLLPKAPSSPGR